MHRKPNYFCFGELNWLSDASPKSNHIYSLFGPSAHLRDESWGLSANRSQPFTEGKTEMDKSVNSLGRVELRKG